MTPTAPTGPPNSYSTACFTGDGVCTAAIWLMDGRVREEGGEVGGVVELLSLCLLLPLVGVLLGVLPRSGVALPFRPLVAAREDDVASELSVPVDLKVLVILQILKLKVYCFGSYTLH